MLGILCFQRGRLGEAANLLQTAVELVPREPILLCNLGTVLEGLGRLGEALECQKKALAIVSDYAEAWQNRATVLLALKRLQEALDSAERAIRIKPAMAEAHFARANALVALGRPDEALQSYDAALRIRPTYVEAHCNRGAALLTLMRPAEALASFERATAANPQSVEALLNGANTLRELGRTKEAIERYDRVLALKPDLSEAWNNRGNALLDSGQLAEARESYARAIALRPDYTHAMVQYIHNSQQTCSWNGLDDLIRNLLDKLHREDFDGPPFAMLSLSDDPALQRRAAESFVRIKTKGKSGSATQPARAGVQRSSDRIRLGYMSSDFREHPVAYLLAELIEIHDRQRFEVIGLDTGRNDDSAMRDRLQRAFDRWIVASGTSDQGLQLAIREAGIDILVDLGGHTMASRHFALSGRPAPVQVSYLGYIGTSGAPYMDYVIADKFVALPAQASAFTERIAYLPDCFQVSDRRRAIAEGTLSRIEHGLPDHGFVFCCFNTSYKINKSMFDVWAQVLSAVPASVLWLISSDPVSERNLRQEAAARGVSADRLIFAKRVPYPQHLARLALADLFLDTWPYNAGATASDALWAGLPVLTLTGRSFASRMGGSMLQAIGLPELVTGSISQYEELAVRLATNPDMMAGIKARLSANRDTAPLFKTDRFRIHIEEAYSRMWEIHCSGRAPVEIDLCD